MAGRMGWKDEWEVGAKWGASRSLGQAHVDSGGRRSQGGWQSQWYLVNIVGWGGVWTCGCCGLGCPGLPLHWLADSHSQCLELTPLTQDLPLVGPTCQEATPILVSLAT